MTGIRLRVAGTTREQADRLLAIQVTLVRALQAKHAEKSMQVMERKTT
jgi:hypothetical protein